MSTPSDHDHASHPDARAIVAELAAKHGVQLPPATGPLEILDPQQARQAANFMRFKAASTFDQPDDPAPEVAVRGARILHAARTAPLRERHWGLPDDPEHPDAADFSDVNSMFDQWAARIHGSGCAGRHERHERPRG